MTATSCRSLTCTRFFNRATLLPSSSFSAASVRACVVSLEQRVSSSSMRDCSFRWFRPSWQPRGKWLLTSLRERYRHGKVQIQVPYKTLHMISRLLLVAVCSETPSNGPSSLVSVTKSHILCLTTGPAHEKATTQLLNLCASKGSQGHSKADLLERRKFRVNVTSHLLALSESLLPLPIPVHGMQGITEASQHDKNRLASTRDRATTAET